MIKKFNLAMIVIILFLITCMNVAVVNTQSTSMNVESVLQFINTNENGKIKNYFCTLDIWLEVEDWWVIGTHNLPNTTYGIDVICWFKGAGTLEIKGLLGQQSADGIFKGYIVGFAGFISVFPPKLYHIRGFGSITFWEKIS